MAKKSRSRVARVAYTPRRLGRLKSVDKRDHLYLLRRPAKLSTLQSKTWKRATDAPWDQGETSRCTAFGGGGLLAAAPVRNKVPPKSEGINLDDWLTYLYGLAQDNDEWPGSDYDGSSVRGVMEALVKLGFITEYRWAFDVDTIIHHLLTVGPMVVGTDWTKVMFRPVNGFIQVMDAQGKYVVEGGHCYLLRGVDRRKKCPDGTKGAFLILNSWGKGWGVKGEVWISFADFAILLRNGGEAAVASEVVKVTAKGVEKLVRLVA